MTAKIRLNRGGSKRRPFFKIVVADSRRPRDGAFLERLGHYNPMLPKDHPDRIVMNTDKAKAWLEKGAQPTERVHRMLAELGVLPAYKPYKQTKAHLPKDPDEREKRLKQERGEPVEEESEAGA
jgi:small subunit ribosomal protein S16